jgi:hypothetical protein
MGRYSERVWWYYFPIAFAIKTPLPTLPLLLIALAALWKRPEIGLLIFPWCMGTSTLVSSINIGYRHLVPILPGLFVFIARLAVFPLGQLRAHAVPFAYFDPAPSWYAIGATTLQGSYTPDVDTFAYFRAMPPTARIGHALDIYHVPEEPVSQ